jgi:hypothetical protein
MEQNETTASHRLRDFDTRNGQVLVTESISAQRGSSLNAHQMFRFASLALQQVCQPRWRP